MITRTLLPADGYLGLKPRELVDYSLGELIQSAAVGDERRLGFYRDCSRTIEQRLGRTASTGASFYLPVDYMTRDLATGSGGGGSLTGTQVSFASGLFGASLIGTLPLRHLPLTGDLSLGVVGSIATQWLAGEGASASHADPTFGARAASPRTVICSFYVSRQFAHQAGPGGMQFLEQQIGAKLAETADTALINGSGASGQPAGLLLYSGTTSTSGTSLAWSGIRDLIAAAEGYTVGGLSFVMGTTAAKVLRAREKATGNGMVMADGKIDGIPVIVSRACPADALVLAPWPSVVMATWGTPELTVTPLADPTAFKQGRIGVRLVWSLDFAAEQPSAIGKSTSIT